MKYGHSVRVKKAGFYQGCLGTVIGYDYVDNIYLVQLEHNTTAYFYESDLVRLK